MVTETGGFALTSRREHHLPHARVSATLKSEPGSYSQASVPRTWPTCRFLGCSSSSGTNRLVFEITGQKSVVSRATPHVQSWVAC